MIAIADILAELHWLGTAADVVVTNFARFFSRFHWVSLVSAVALAYLVWCWQRRNDPRLARKGFIGFLFPRSVWLHRSALLDYRFVLVDKLLLGVLLGLGAVVFAPQATEAVVDEVVKEVGEDISASLGLIVAYTIALLVVEDFARYWAHRIMHMSPLLWQFHKVHHSPEVLVPFSQMRNHPVNGLVNLIRSGLSIGVVTGVFLLIFPGQLNAITILGVNAGRFVFDAMGSHLRHSHVWLSWGPRLSRILISPAQHQIHHSRLPRHFDKNFGSQFAIWDWMFGTLYVPERRERVAFGIGRKETERLQSVKALYLEPLRDARRVLQRRRRARAAAAAQ
jgi:sterol desaturase/sphingolipid hydroxylase (fatty acid hydroxylase superfamily)